MSKKGKNQIYSNEQRFIGGTKREARNLEAARQILKAGNDNRHVRETKLNACSSRSHAIFTIHISSNDTQSTMNLVDLAGSERANETDHQGEALIESKHINRDIMNLRLTLRAMASKKNIPYRDSTLTKILNGTFYISDTEA